MVPVPPVPLSSACSEHVPMSHMTQHHHGTELPSFGFRYLGFESGLDLQLLHLKAALCFGVFLGDP